MLIAGQEARAHLIWLAQAGIFFLLISFCSFSAILKMSSIDVPIA
jgi:hypothetical protein